MIKKLYPSPVQLSDLHKTQFCTKELSSTIQDKGEGRRQVHDRWLTGNRYRLSCGPAVDTTFKVVWPGNSSSPCLIQLMICICSINIMLLIHDVLKDIH